MEEQGMELMIMGSGGLEAAEEEERRRQVKAEIATHPLWEQLVGAHVACLRAATPVDQLPLIEAQLSQSHNLLASYYALHHNHNHNNNNNHSLPPHERQELDNFLALPEGSHVLNKKTRSCLFFSAAILYIPGNSWSKAQYLLLLCSFKEHIEQHVRVHAVEAVMACRQIEHNLHALTGAILGEGSGATMSDEEEEDLEMGLCFDHIGGGADNGPDMMGFGPLLPTESERSLMERVRHELKIELKQGFKSRIEDVREEILRKRRAGKLPGDTTTVLKNWWQQHSKWPYPTEDDKAKLVEETGLQLKQINNWFINQRKRNWHNNSHSLTSLKSKRKR
ncbi:unnamed protein product [Cuscuta campestris]|uniref:Homeobox domain-containing protein n=1 Tax=Cuscuta campestris TaxID=132261 RepID=A0A484MGD3_9ASTE|nr:unnamed protein product [Cuscuta campestris]